MKKAPTSMRRLSAFRSSCQTRWPNWRPQSYPALAHGGLSTGGCDGYGRERRDHRGSQLLGFSLACDQFVYADWWRRVFVGRRRRAKLSHRHGAISLDMRSSWGGYWHLHHSFICRCMDSFQASLASARCLAALFCIVHRWCAFKPAAISQWFRGASTRSRRGSQTSATAIESQPRQRQLECQCFDLRAGPSGTPLRR